MTEGNIKIPSIFDEYIDCKNTRSVKYDFIDSYNKPADIIPMWVADMDFKAPAAVIQALHSMAEHGIYGYSAAKESYDQAVSNWFQRNFNWIPLPEWNIKAPGVVFAIAVAIRAFTSVGDGVLIQQPVYYPFMSLINSNQRKPAINELHLINGHYEIDFDNFEQLIQKENIKLFILCSPHNPVGRVWNNNELNRMGEICRRYGVYVISDEIHADFVYSGYKHTIFAGISQELADITVTCTSPTKTFNLAGLQVSNIFISNKEMRTAFKREYEKTGYAALNKAGLAAAEAAYTFGQSWRDQLIGYLENNIDYLQNSLTGTGIKLIWPEGTYLMWLDCRQLDMNDTQLADFFINKAKLWLHNGNTFGQGGSGFMRMNIACPLVTLKQAVNNLQKSLR